MFQPELFQNLPSEQKPRHFRLAHFPGRFFRLRVAYEDAVFAMLGFVLVVLAGFCLGVERGKRVGPQPQPIETIGIATARESMPALLLVPAAPSRKSVPVTPVAVSAIPAQRPEMGDFVIQLATYNGPSSADEEGRRLAKRGIQTQVVKQGPLLELRAVGYRSKPAAKAALGVLRQNYPDAFLKRVSVNSNN